MEKFKAVFKFKRKNSKKEDTRKDKSNTPKNITTIKHESYAELNKKVLNGCDLYVILKCAKVINKFKNPYIIILSTKTDKQFIIDLHCDRPQNINYSVTKGTIHKDIKKSIINIINDKFNESFDGLIVVLLCIVRIQITNGITDFKFYYDRKNEPRHVDKLKKDVLYRIDDADNKKNKVYMHYFTAIIDNMDTANDGSKPRLEDKNNILERRVKEIEDKIRQKYVKDAGLLMVGYFREQNVLHILSSYQISQTVFLYIIGVEMINKERARAQLALNGYLRNNTGLTITQQMYDMILDTLIAFYCW